MPIQLAFTDRFARANPQAYAVIENGSWKRGDAGFQIGVSIYASKAAFDAHAEPVHSFTKFVTFDSSSMNSGIEQAVMQDPLVAAGSPSQVA
jgi:hypothetical protein